MKLKSENNIIKLQNGNRLALFQKAVNAVQNRNAQALQEVNDKATLIEQDDHRIAYNQLHGLPQETRFVPSNGGTITEHEGPLYNNKFEKVLDDTAKGQLAVRMADTLKKGVGLGFAVAGGNWLLNGLKVAPFLTSMELLGGATAGKLGKSVGKRIDNKLHTHNQIVDFEKVLPLISMIGGAKGAKSWFENNTIRGAIESGFQNLKFIPAQVKYYGPTMGKSYAAKTNDNLIDLDTWGKPEYNKLAKKYGYKDWREMILSDKGDYNAEYKALIKDQIKRIQSNPQYSGKTIVVSNASFLNHNSGIEFASTPVIPEREIMAQRNNTRHPWESIEHGREWWDSLNQKGTPLKIDNRFVSEIEGNKVIQVDHPYQIMGRLKMNPGRDVNTPDYLSNTYFGEPMKPGTESDVFESPFENNVIKIQHGEYVTPQEAIIWSNKRMNNRNKVPFIQKPIKRIGLMIGPTGGYTPVYSQPKLKPLTEKLDLNKIKSIFDKRMIENGWSKTLEDFSYKKDGKHVNFWDLKNDNLGLDEDGNLFGFDLDVFKQGGILKGQLGLSNIPVNPNVVKRTYDKVNSFLNPISKWESEHGVKANASLGPLMWLENPEAFAGVDLATIDPAHVGAKFLKEPIPKKIISSTTKFSKPVVKQPMTKMEKGLHTYVKNKYPEDLANWEKYLDEYMKYWTKKKK